MMEKLSNVLPHVLDADVVSIATLHRARRVSSAWKSVAETTLGALPQVVVLGGGSFNSGYNAVSAYRSTEALDLNRMAFVSMPPMKSARTDFAAAVTKDPSGGEKVVVLGGVDRYACGQPMCECEAELMEDVEGFNPVTAKWEILPNLPIALAGAVAIAPGGGRGEILVFGGARDSKDEDTFVIPKKALETNNFLQNYIEDAPLQELDDGYALRTGGGSLKWSPSDKTFALTNGPGGPKWEERAPFPPFDREWKGNITQPGIVGVRGGAVVAIGDDVVRVGEYNSMSVPGELFSNQVSVYRPSSDEWLPVEVVGQEPATVVASRTRSKAAAPSRPVAPKVHGARGAEMLGGMDGYRVLAVLGGKTDFTSAGRNTATVRTLAVKVSPNRDEQGGATAQWADRAILPKLPIPLDGFGTCAVGRTIFIAGGAAREFHPANPMMHRDVASNMVFMLDLERTSGSTSQRC